MENKKADISDFLNIVLVEHGVRPSMVMEKEHQKLPKGLASKQVYYGGSLLPFTIVAKNEYIVLIPEQMSQKEVGKILGYMEPMSVASIRDELGYFVVTWFAVTKNNQEILLYGETIHEETLDLQKLFEIMRKYTAVLNGKENVESVIFKLKMNKKDAEGYAAAYAKMQKK